MKETAMLDARHLSTVSGCAPRDVSSGSLKISARRERFPEIDLLKAVSILTVVLIHALSADRMFRNDLLFEQLLGELCLFAVPAFLFAAGFLFDKSRRSSTPALAGKLAKRLLLPYLVCSLVIGGATLFVARWQHSAAPFTLRQFLTALALGKVVGIYYFVFVIAYLYAFGLWLRWWTARAVDALGALSALLLAAYSLGLLDPFGLLGRNTSFDVMFRHPIRHLFPFLAGWVVSLRYHTLRPWLIHRQHRLLPLLIVAEIGLLALLSATGELNEARPPALRLALQVQIILIVATILLAGMTRPAIPQAVTAISSASYAIYLLHLPILTHVQQVGKQLHLAGVSLRMLFVWPVSVAATLLLIRLLRGVVKDRSAPLIGY